MGAKVGGTDELNSEINVTPMVDVMLVLLIIFMIVTPLLNEGVAVNLPKDMATPVEDAEIAGAGKHAATVGLGEIVAHIRVGGGELRLHPVVIHEPCEPACGPAL